MLVPAGRVRRRLSRARGGRLSELQPVGALLLGMAVRPPQLGEPVGGRAVQVHGGGEVESDGARVRDRLPLMHRLPARRTLRAAAETVAFGFVVVGLGIAGALWYWGVERGER